MPERGIWCAKALLPGGWCESVRLVLTADGVIRSVVEAPAAQGDVVLPGITIPGMPNAHSHGFQRLMTGLTGQLREGGDSFWGWRNTMYTLANRISPEQLADCMAFVYMEMLLAGYTSCVEFHYLHHQPDGRAYGQAAEMSLRVLAAADAAGISVTLAPVLYQVSGFGAAGPEAHQRRFSQSLDAYLALLDDCRHQLEGRPLHRLGVAPHSLRAVPLDALRALTGALPENDTPIHIHVAEQPAEVEACLEAHGARPVELLLDRVGLDRRWCLVHATHVTADECTRAARSGAVAGVCPSTEADLGDGFFGTPAWLDAGGRLAIGSDSNLRISPSEELRLLEFAARLRTGTRQVLRSPEQACGRFLYEHAAHGGAQALGQAVGQLDTGHRADLVELDAEHPLLVGRSQDEWLESYVFGGHEGMIRSVFVGGEQRVAEGRHPAEAALRERFASVTRALTAR
ncbi:MAG: formimidoylglutamate deiminase [Xanthomonadales bacterium]|nr:formimidoylglutamate deiminase [Xanthomonadales bacterium]